MRRLPLFLALFCLAGPVLPQDEEDEGEKVKDEKSGLSFRMPSTWSRDTASEKGSTRFAAIYDLTKTRYVLFRIETGPASGFDEAAWLAAEKAAVTKFLKSVDAAWTTEPAVVGGERAVRYTIGGKMSGEKEYDLRVRGCGIVRGDIFFRITEQSFNNAHAEAADALRAMWDAVKFEEANPFAQAEEEGGGEESGSGGEEGMEKPKGEPQVVEDKAGNFKLTILPGWVVDTMPADDEGDGLRMVVSRTTDRGDNLAVIEIIRFRGLNSSLFLEQAADVLTNNLHADDGMFEQFYGEGTKKLIRPEIDARATLGRADNSCGYELRAIPLEEENKMREAQKLRDRGDTSVTVPEYKPLVIRGRIAMISPHIYIVRTRFARALSDQQELLTEYNAILDSWEFSSTEAKPPALTSDGVESIGNTLADPANMEERKKSIVHEFTRGAKVEAALKIDFVLPPGFIEVGTVRDPASNIGYSVGENVPLLIAAQDGNNGWVFIAMTATSWKSLPSNTKFEDKKKVYAGWVSNFDSLARGAEGIKKKPAKIKVGNLSGDGAEFEGKINKFHATEVHMVTDESGWRIQFDLRTRGDGAKTFEDGIKTFMRKFRARKQ
jgi:hypothetical protein